MGFSPPALEPWEVGSPWPGALGGCFCPGLTLRVLTGTNAAEGLLREAPGLPPRRPESGAGRGRRREHCRQRPKSPVSDRNSKTRLPCACVRVGENVSRIQDSEGPLCVESETKSHLNVGTNGQFWRFASEGLETIVFLNLVLACLLNFSPIWS